MTETTTHKPHIRIPPWMGVLIIIMAVASTVSMTVTAYQQRQAAQEQRQAAQEQRECNDAFARNFEARVAWNQEDRDALQRLVTSVFENDSDRAQFRAYKEWLRVTAVNDRRRAAVPLPPLGKCD